MPRSVFNILKNNTHFFAWTVILGFAIWGAGSIALQQQSRGDIAGYVFGQKITTYEFDRTTRAVQLLTASGKDSNISPKQLQDQVWDHIILVHQAKRLGITASDEEVTQQIKSLFGGENFDARQYEMWVQNVFREKPRAFEEQMRNFLMLQKLIDGYRPKLKPTDEEVWNWYKGLFKEPPPAPDNKDPTNKDEKKEKPEDRDAKRKEEFEKSKEQWIKSYVSSKESESIGKAIEDIKKQAKLKDLTPALPAPEVPPASGKNAETKTPEQKITSDSKSPSQANVQSNVKPGK